MTRTKSKVSAANNKRCVTKAPAAMIVLSQKYLRSQPHRLSISDAWNERAQQPISSPNRVTSNFDDPLADVTMANCVQGGLGIWDRRTGQGRPRKPQMPLLPVLFFHVFSHDAIKYTRPSHVRRATQMNSISSTIASMIANAW